MSKPGVRLGTPLFRCHCFAGSSSGSSLEGSLSTIPTEAEQERATRYETRLQRAALRAKREKSILTQPSPIKSLPNELLCKILETAIETMPAQYDPHRVRKHELATVCRHWRDIIANTPSFWSLVRLAPTWGKALVKVHLKRSGQCPLDLVFAGFRSRVKFIALLDIVMPTTHRWRSLSISSQGSIDALFILQTFDNTIFPLLTLLSIPTLPPSEEFKEHRGSPVRIPYYPKFLSLGNAPQLRSLEIRRDFFPLDDIQLPPTLEKLSLDIASYRIYTDEATRWLRSSSLQRLKALSLQGYTTYWKMEPDSIHLPCLTYFSCAVTHAMVVLQGLVTPNLTHVNFIQSHWERLDVPFRRIQSKWGSVRELTFKFTRTYPYIPRTLCLAAPNVRGLEVIHQDLGLFLKPDDGLRPIDGWEHLERFVIVGNVREVGDMRRCLVPWLKERMEFGKPALKVFFSFANSYDIELERGALDEIGKYCGGVDFCMQDSEIGDTWWPDM